MPKKNKTIKIPFPVDEDAQYRVRQTNYNLSNLEVYLDKILERAKPEEVYLDELIASQTEVDIDYVKKLIKTDTYKIGRDGEKEVGFVYRFPDGKLYIQDGHHKLTAAKLAGEETSLVIVADIKDEDLLW